MSGEFQRLFQNVSEALQEVLVSVSALQGITRRLSWHSIGIKRVFRGVPWYLRMFQGSNGFQKRFLGTQQVSGHYEVFFSKKGG